MKIEIKIGRNERLIGEDDLILDNGSCIQVMTQRGKCLGYNSFSPLKMSKTLFNELLRCGFIYPDVGLTKQANAGYNTPWLVYLRFDIDRMAESGAYRVVKE